MRAPPSSWLLLASCACLLVLAMAEESVLRHFYPSESAHQEAVSVHHGRHGHKVQKLGRCRRYAKNYVDHPPVVGCYSRCRQRYCGYCPTYSCRRPCGAPCRDATPIVSTPVWTVRPTPTPCNCDPIGSKLLRCNQISGQCLCKENYTGMKCNQCESGSWSNSTHCIPCTCDPVGSQSPYCHQETGRCACKPGIGGTNCDQCLPNHYGTIETGCKECDPCDKKGHICDPESGKCVCPPLITGIECERCEANAWNYEPGKGCMACECSIPGSTNQQCEEGVCTCKIGYEGAKCNKCSNSYYGEKVCQKCNCNLSGTASRFCSHGTCSCTSEGWCHCKENVKGKKCDSCRKGTFGLENPSGCTECYCSGRSQQCKVSDHSFDQIRTYIGNDCEKNCNQWNFPDQFLGDLTLSYGGYLRIESNSPIAYYEVTLTGNGVTIRAFSNESIILMVEQSWTIVQDRVNLIGCEQFLSRQCFMPILQNVDSIRIQSSTELRNVEVLLDKATISTKTSRASSVEQCFCPKEYTSSSCQDPNDGYYRYFPDITENYNYIDAMVGIALPCQCNGHSKTCDKETGYCSNCTDFTNGPNCELCAEGYYKNSSGACASCLCPSESRNFARTCTVLGKNWNQFVCNCKVGYSGPKCTQCDDGYWGNPQEEGGKCSRCDCNPHGSTASMCDSVTGLCSCKSGFTGRKCSECTSPREVIQDGVCTACDECAQILFNTIDGMSNDLNLTLDLFSGGIGPPWPKLNETFHIYTNLADRFNEKITKANEIIHERNLPNLEKTLEKMVKEVARKNKTITKHAHTIEILCGNSTKLNEEIAIVEGQIKAIIANLDEFGKSHIDTREALRQAKEILAGIKERSKHVLTQEDYDDFFRQCNTISDEVNRIYSDSDLSPNVIKTKLHDLKERLSDLLLLLNQTESTNTLTRTLNKRNSKRIDDLSRTITAIAEKNATLTEDVSELMNKINSTNAILQEVSEIHRELSSLEDLGNRVNTDEDTVDLFDTLTDVREHVLQLQNRIRTYKTLFNFTKEEWTKIDASGAYEKLIKGIRQAEEIAHQAKNLTVNTLQLLYPEGKDSLQDSSNIAMAFSDRLIQRMVNLQKPTEEFNKIREQLEDLKYKIRDNGRNNNDLLKILHNMRQQLKNHGEKLSQLEKVQEDAKNVSDGMAEIVRKVNDEIAQYNLSKAYQKYLNLTSGDEIGKLMDQIPMTKVTLQNINFTQIDKVHEANEQRFRNNDINLKTLENQINSLKNKIQYAKEAADSINIAISINNCRRTYFMEEDIFHSLTIVFQCSNNCNLLKLTNQANESVELTVQNGSDLKIKWKNNNEIRKLKIDGTRTTTVSIQRELPFVRVLVGGQIEVIADRRAFNIDSGNTLKIGKVSSSKENSTACLHSVVLNNRVVGLWKFAETRGSCPGCYKDSTNTEASFFDMGYRNVTFPKVGHPFEPRNFEIKFELSTFDENSLIFLAQDIDDPCSFLILQLKDGFLHFKIRHVDGTEVALTGKERLNHGRRVAAGITMNHDNSQQTYVLERGRTEHQEELPKKNLFKIKNTFMFMGGIPDTFAWRCPLVNTSFQRFLGHLHADSEQLNNLMDTISYNTKSQSIPLTKAWFLGQGFLNLHLQKPTSVFEISFWIKPANDNGYLINIGDVMDVFIRDKKIIVRSNNEECVATDSILKLNTVIEIAVNGASYNLRVNDEEYKCNNPIDLALMSSELYLGKDRENNIPKYSGGINNIVINNKTIIFTSETVKDFHRVEIGRERTLNPAPKLRSSFIIESPSKDMQSTEGCSFVANYETDPNAVKFGDKPDSYIFIENSFWKQDYTIEFEFRTFYPNGLLFISVGTTKQKHYNILEVQDGKLRFRINGKRMKAIVIGQNINDGQWHSIVIRQTGIKKKRKVILELDGVAKKPARPPKNHVKGELYVGGIPGSLPEQPELSKQLHPLRGCLRSLKINQIPQVLLKNKKHVQYNNIGQCFPHVETGAYFGGDAFAIYKDDFRVNSVLELSLEFRTVEQNGILLSVSNAGNSPALSVELQGGAVVMTIDMGNGAISNVTNNIDSDFTLCNNRWHNITALYSSSELTVNVDGIRKSWVQSDVNSLMDEIEAALYVGGLPVNAPTGTLKIKENFKGCIRKLNIKDSFKDWTDMQELNNVLLNACPIDSA